VPVFCGIDWAEDHYDVALVDQAGVVLTQRRIDDDAIGYQLLLALLAEHGDDQVEPISVAIETPRGLVVACLRRTGRQVYAINPLSVARYRERHSVARTKSDRVDAQLLANILRTDRAAHRPLPADSELAQAVAVLARAQQDAVWNRQQVANQLRSLLREYYPAFVEAFQGRRPGGLAHPDACAVLAIAPTPTQAARLTRPQLQAALRRAGRQRGIRAASVRLQAIFRRTWLHQLSMVEAAMGRQALALLKQLEAAAQAADDLAEATRLVFQQHPQMAIFTSFPGLGELPAARLLAEIGDDSTRFADARGLKAYAGAAPVTRERQEACGAPPQNKDAAPRRGRLPVDVRRATPLNRCQSSLRSASCGWRPSRRCPTPPVQPLPRPPVLLPSDGPDLRRSSGIPGSSADCCLTRYVPGMSRHSSDVVDVGRSSVVGSTA
jgi:transposase